MRIFTVYFQACLFVVCSISTSTLFGNSLSTHSDEAIDFIQASMLTDTTCGLTDTVIQLTLPICTGDSSATAMIQLEGDSGPVLIEWDNGTRGATGTNLSPGKHFVTVTNLDNCILIDSIVIADKPALAYTITANDPLCVGVTNGNITITDTSALRYNWNTGDSINMLSNLAAGVYQVTISDTLGCNVVESIAINNSTRANSTITGTDATCFGLNNGSAIVNDTISDTGYNYLWSTGDTTKSLTNLSPATYFVLATSPDGCLSADSINILSERVVTITPTITNTTCAGVANGSISINDPMDVTGFRFGWSTGDSTQMISNLAAGVYTVAVADTSGCINAAAITISNSRQLDIISSVVDASCDVAMNGSITVNDTANVYQFNWSTGDTTQTIVNLGNGTYQVAITDTVGCVANDSIMVGITPTLNATNTSVNATCNGVNDGSVIVNQGADLTGINISWNTGDTTQMLTGLPAGTYQVMLADTFGCTAADTTLINEGIPFTIIATSTDATCDGLDNGMITLNDTTGVTGLTFAWNTGDSTQTITGLSAGDYSYTVTDTIGCTATGVVALGTIKTIPLEINRTDVSCVGLSDGIITINEGLDNSDLIFSWNTGDSTQTISNISEGSYTISVTDTLGCSATSIINIIASNSLSITLSQTNASCTGLTDGTVTIDEGSDLTGFTINWNTGADSQILSDVGVGTYTATVTDTLGCMAIDSIEVAADSSLQIGLTGNNIDCVNDSTGRITASAIDLDSNDGLSFAWNTGDTTAALTNLTIGSYEVTVTDSTGCFGTAGATLEQGDSIKVNFVVSPVACMDTIGSGAILAVATGGSGSFTYDWSNGGTNSTIGNLLAGTYVLTVFDSLGCTFTDSVTLLTPPDLIVAAFTLQDATCEGSQDGRATVITSEGTTPYNIRWNNGIITPTIENLNPGIYTVVVSDAAGCEITDTIITGSVTQINLTTTEINGASSQNDADGIATVSASGGLLPYTFNWDNGAVGDTVNNLSAGNHLVVATDANGCIGTDSVNISFFELEVSIIDTRNLRCNADNRGRATAAPVTGTAPFKYIWSTGDTTPTLTTLPAGIHSVTVTDVNGMKGRGSVTLTEPAPIYFNLEIIPPGCPTSGNGRITINATNTVGNPLYDFGVGITPNPFILGVTAGTKTYGIIDGNNCNVDTTFTIEALAPNPPSTAFAVTSLGLVATFTDQTGNDPTDYLWKFGDGTTSDQQNPIHQYPDTGRYEVCLIATNPCDVDSICQTILIQDIPIPGVTLNFGRDTSSLSGQQVSIPVMVGAFEDIAGITGTFELSNPMIGAIQGIRNFNLPNLTINNFTVQDNLISIDWSVADTSSLVSLPSGTQIFTIDLLLTGTSDACTEIIATDTETALQFTKTFMGALVPAPFTLNSAEVCIAATVSIAGNISREEAENIAGVTVTTNGQVTSTTAEDGNYSLPGLPGGATFNIDANKSDEILLGVTTFDLVRVLQHILTQQPLTSPYKIIAADIDNSGSVSSLDLVHLQRLILQQIDAFPNNQPWRFVPESYIFMNPANPLAENFPETIELSRLEIDTANIDFVAIKVGDVVSDINAGNARYLPKSMGFEIDEQSFKKGDLITIPFNFKATNAALGFQLEFNFDAKKLAFKGAAKDSYLTLTTSNFGQKNIEYGHLKMLWVNQQQLPIRPMGNGLFQLEFIALADGQLSEVIQLNQDQFPPQFYSKAANKIGLQNIDLVINNAKITIEENNPTNTSFMVGGENTTAGGCSDDLDNDGDGLVDCEDADCFCECNMTVDNGNLIINPGAEQTINSGGWEMVQGDWTTRGSNPAPQNGAAYFYPLNSETAQLSQVIDLSADSVAIAQGLVTYIFTGYVRSFDQEPSDEAQILLEYRNAADSTVARFDSGLVTSLDNWQLLGDTTIAPSGTTTAIINLIARRKNGTNNDAFFDNLSLTKIVNDSCEAPCDDVGILTLTTDAIPNNVGGSAAATLVNGTGMATYNWSNSDTTNEVTNLIPGLYTVTATDSLGCTVMDSIEIVADSSFFANLTTVSNFCSGDSTGSIIVEVTGGTAPFSFSWADSTLMGDTLQNLVSGTYEVTITDSLGAILIVSAIVESGSTISLNMELSKIVNESCPNTNDGQLSLVAMGGTAPYTYILNNDTTNNGVYLDLTAGDYSVSIIDANGCRTTTTIAVGLDLTGTLSAAFTSEVGATNVVLTSAVQDSTATYSWTFGDGNNSSEINPTITYAAAGAYEICLTISNDCGSEMTCQTVTFGITGPVKFVINDLNGIANDTVVVPITVENFIDIVSYQKTLQIQDTAIARIVGISAPNLPGLTSDNFYQVDDHTLTTVWFDATGLGQNLPNNTVIYNLMVMIDSQVDTCVELNFVESPVASQVVGIMVDEVAEVPFELVNGEICTNESIEVTGNIVRETGTAIPGVQIGVSNFEKTPTTDIDGNYLIEKLSIGNDYEITPALNTPLLESVSTFDIVLINRHILGTRFFDSPYKHIAADINQSGTITVFDLVLIQRAILGLNSNFPGNTAWRFIPKAYEFVDPTNPLDENFPESINLTGLNSNLDNVDFIAVKVADVSYNITTSTGRTAERLTLNLENQHYAAGEIIEVPVTSKDLNKLSGFQLELGFNANDLTLVDINTHKAAGINSNNIGLKYINQGKVQVVWVAPNLEMETTTTLFTLQFKAKSAGTLSSTLQLSNRYLLSESYSNDLGIGEVQLAFETSPKNEFTEFTIYPNPTKGLLNISFTNTNQESVQLSLYNLTGQLVKEWVNITGTATQLDLSPQLSGTYLLMLKRADGVEVKRLVLNR